MVLHFHFMRGKIAPLNNHFHNLALAISCPKPAFHKILTSDINRKGIKRFSFLLRAMMFFNWAKFVNCSFMD